MDAFAVSISKGLTLQRVTIQNSIIVGLYFGSFQAVMPLIAYLIASRFAGVIVAIDHWIAFSLLVLIGGKMIYEALRKDKHKEESDSKKNDGSNPHATESTLKPSQMFPLAIATSIDAMAVGVSFAFLQVNIVPAVSLIGVITLILSMIGVKIGSIVGIKFKTKAEIAGGVVLILIGVKILLEHTGVLVF